MNLPKVTQYGFHQACLTPETVLFSPTTRSAPNQLCDLGRTHRAKFWPSFWASMSVFSNPRSQATLCKKVFHTWVCEQVTSFLSGSQCNFAFGSWNNSTLYWGQLKVLPPTQFGDNGASRLSSGSVSFSKVKRIPADFQDQPCSSGCSSLQGSHLSFHWFCATVRESRSLRGAACWHGALRLWALVLRQPLGYPHICYFLQLSWWGEKIKVGGCSFWRT